MKSPASVVNINGLFRNMDALIAYRERTHQPVTAPIVLTPEQFRIFLANPDYRPQYKGVPVVYHE